jgi:hypothetical protein
VECPPARADTGREACRITFSETWKRVLGLALAFGVVLWLGGLWPPLTIAGRWIFLLASLAYALDFLTNCLLGLASSLLDGYQQHLPEASFWLLACTALRLVGVALAVSMTLYLWRGSVY